MSIKFLVGEQLDSRVLYERQKTLRARQTYLPGPMIIAAGLQVPENIGSVLRLADAAGSQRVIIINDGDPSHSQKRIHRTARNCEVLVKWEFWTPAKFIELNDSFQPLIAVELTTGSTSIFENTLPDKCAFMIGNERHGIPLLLLAKCQQAVHIPMYGVNGSMNVTHALAVALFEWRRQHSESSGRRSVCFRAPPPNNTSSRPEMRSVRWGC